MEVVSVWILQAITIYLTTALQTMEVASGCIIRVITISYSTTALIQTIGVAFR